MGLMAVERVLHASLGAAPITRPRASNVILTMTIRPSLQRRADLTDTRLLQSSNTFALIDIVFAAHNKYS